MTNCKNNLVNNFCLQKNTCYITERKRKNQCENIFHFRILNKVDGDIHTPREESLISESSLFNLWGLVVQRTLSLKLLEVRLELHLLVSELMCLSPLDVTYWLKSCLDYKLQGDIFISHSLISLNHFFP